MDKVRITIRVEELNNLVRFLRANVDRHNQLFIELRHAAKGIGKMERMSHGLRRDALNALHTRVWTSAPRFDGKKDKRMWIPRAEACALVMEYVDNAANPSFGLARICGEIDQALA